MVISPGGTAGYLPLLIAVSRPSGTENLDSASTTVETVGYCQSSLWDDQKAK
ncbi:MAG: hypothetical protein NTX50_08890 [Candidatus Sumerlaeota bacterium]|nr:hypothetical protein [Candidatus Sumerlaeota bacterium]